MDILVLDRWFFVQLVNFLVMLVIVNYVLISPIRRMLRLRAERMASQAEEIDAFSQAAEGKLAAYQAALEEARREAGQVRTTLREEGAATEKGLLETAGAKAAESLGAARALIVRESETAKQAMLGQVSAMAAKAAGKVLGKAL
ncbi:ATP synthase F0 subunit B [Fundidesulfovibrio butyratiphilus]